MPRLVTLERLRSARQTVARVIQLHGDAYLPILARLNREIEAMEAREKLMASVRELAAGGE